MKQFIHEREDFRDLIAALSGEIKIEAQLIEKDYWIMHALWGLNALKFKYELKGGTSLSKGWKCIDRFSEDIDIYIHPPSARDVPIGKNQTKESHVSARRAYFESLLPKLQIPGFEGAVRDNAFDDKLMRNAGIRLIYPNLFGQIEGLKDGILLEIGFDQTTPNEALTISSWIWDKAAEVKLDVVDNRAKKVKCYIPEYTFVEKLQTVSTKYRQHQEKGLKPVNFMRHYYDLFQLLKLTRVQQFIGTKPYFEHKANRFRAADEADLTKNEAFLVSNAKTRRLYQEAFDKTKNLYYSGHPHFDEILESLRPWLAKLS